MIIALASWLAGTRSLFFNLFVCLALRLSGKEVRFKWIQAGRYPPSGDPRLHLELAQASDILLLEARKSLETELHRREYVRGKFKTLLTLSGFALSALALLTTESCVGGERWTSGIGLFSILLLLASIFVLLACDDVGEETAVCVGREEAALDEVNLKKSFINSYLTAADDASLRTDYMTDLYRLARTLTLSALLLLTALLVQRLL